MSDSLEKPKGVKRLTNTAILLGKNVSTPLEKLRAMSPDEFEDVVLEWANGYLFKKYEKVNQKVYGIGGAGDKGRDIIAYTDFKNNKLDYFQCKRYSTPLSPSDIYLELGKLCYYVKEGQITKPESFVFVASNGISPTSNDLIYNHKELSKNLIDNWNSACKTKITSTKNIDITKDKELKEFIEKFDFSIVSHKPELELIEEHRQTIWFPTRFGGGLVKYRETIPKASDKIKKNELVYIDNFFKAYSDFKKKEINKPEDLKGDGDLQEHFQKSRDSFYSAESLRVFSRDNLAESEVNPFEELKDEVYHTISGVLLLPQENAYYKLIHATNAAIVGQYNSNPLSPELKAQDKEGICHHLSNENRISWKR